MRSRWTRLTCWFAFGKTPSEAVGGTMGKRHPGTIEKRGKSFRVILYSGGRRHAFTLPSLDRAEAVDFARRKHLELERLTGRERQGLPGRVSLSILLDRFESERLPLLSPNTQRTYAISLNLFRRFFVQGR